jgi:hypothetical protein
MATWTANFRSPRTTHIDARRHKLVTLYGTPHGVPFFLLAVLT